MHDPYGTESSPNRAQRRAATAVEAKATKKYYRLFAGRVIAKRDDEAMERSVNTVVTSDHPYTNATSLGKAQQALQLAAIREFNDSNIEIVDVFLVSINELGYMTQAQWMEGQPKQAADVLPE